MLNLDEIIAFLKKEAADIKMEPDLDKIKEDLLFAKDLGFDSLDYAQLVLAGEKFAGVSLDENTIDWRKVQTIKSLAQHLKIKQCISSLVADYENRSSFPDGPYDQAYYDGLPKE